jgi:hypothetical protein
MLISYATFQSLSLPPSSGIFAMNVVFARYIFTHIAVFCLSSESRAWETEREERGGEREKTRREVGVRDTTFKGEQENVSPPGLKVPRQCSLFLLLEVRLREGKA